MQKQVLHTENNYWFSDKPMACGCVQPDLNHIII